MIVFILRFSLFVFMSFSAFAAATSDEQYETLIREMRCVSCQNQSLSESNAPIAMGIKAEIRHQLNEGKTPENIKQFLAQKYGNTILYRPPFERRTLFLWLGPALLLLPLLYFWRRWNVKIA